MKKVVMNLEDYKGNYAMHCPTKESAKLFCNFLDENGREWENGRSYKEYTFWGVYKNEGMFNGAERDEEEELTILEIDDFIVDDEEKLTIMVVFQI